MKHLKLTSAMIACALALSACHADKPKITIGIIEPLEVTAMGDIVHGFETTLQQEIHTPIQFEVLNAQNDPNLQHAIIQTLKDHHTTLIAPIGTSATQMTLSMVKDHPVIALAADMKESERPHNVAVVHDEISAEKQMVFIHAAFPTLTELTLIHSPGNTIFQEVKEAQIAGQKLGITVHDKMVSTLPELTTVSQNLGKDTQGIFILKDAMIVEGAPVLEKIAAQRKIPFITSDEGSVHSGAALALGVHEDEIGVQGAYLAAAILKGEKPDRLPIATMKNLTVFINPKTVQTENLSMHAIETSATKLGYKIEITGEPS